ncbi:J domain-containing protein CG6693 [Euwallacea similis]|uniref:J domain-containing protein CG6693 n=1 Tax=Euwallacea similis TaxID=1736056 RepID=UPI00344CBD8F
MTTFEDKCTQYFGTTNFYEVLGVSQESSEKEIKKAYHKLSLLVHPDRVDEQHKAVATEKFKVLGRIHSVLQDKDKRKIYDDCGEFDSEADSTFNWAEYWLSMFKKIEISDIKRYEEEYVGSETERRDIKRAYESGKGNMNVLLEMVPFSRYDNEDRLIAILREMVDNGEVPEYDGFFNESKAKRNRRHKKWAKEQKEVENVDISQLEKEIDAAHKRRAEEFGSFLYDLEKKYAPKKSRKYLTGGTEKKEKACKSKK